MRLRASIVSLALMGAFAQAGAAVSPDLVLGHAELTLSNLRWSLVDLAPDDGIAPSLTLDTSSGIKGSVSTPGSGSTSQQFAFVPGQNTPFSLSLPSGQASVSRDDQGTFTSESELRLKNVGAGLGEFNVSSGASSDWAFTLSPHTQLVLQGSATIGMEAGIDQLIGSELTSGPQRRFKAFTHNVRGLLSVQLRDLAGQQTKLFSADKMQITSWSERDGVWRKTFGRAFDGNFQLVFSNTSATDLAGRMTLRLDGGSVVTVTSVPEPESLAMVGAGLLAVWGLRRRKAA